ECASQHFGVWAAKPGWLTSMVTAYKAGALPKAAAIPSDSGPGYQIEPGGVATVVIDGMMMKGDSSFGGTSTVRTRRAIRGAAADPNVRAIALRISSPGGHVHGTPELAAEVKAAAATKPVHAFAEDIMASAAYWVASQARSISVNPTGEVGSIGVFGVVEDTSGM